MELTKDCNSNMNLMETIFFLICEERIFHSTQPLLNKQNSVESQNEKKVLFFMKS